MGLGLKAGLSGLLIALLGGTALAQAPASASSATAIPVPVAVPAPVPATQPAEEAKPAVTDPIVVATLAAIAREATSGRLAVERDLIPALQKTYTERNQPFWVSGSGVRESAVKAVAEIRRADEWGLDAKAFDLPTVPSDASPEALAAFESRLTYAVLKYAWHARGGRIDPTALSLWLDQKPRGVDVQAVLAKIADGQDPARAIRQLHPQHPQFELLRQTYLKARGWTPATDAVAAPKPIEALPPGPVLRPGIRHPDVAILRRRLDVPAQAGNEDLYDPNLAQAVKTYLRKAGLSGSALVGTQARAALNKPTPPHKSDKGHAGEAAAKRILANMERWRWLPSDLGQLYVWNNLPEYETRVFKAGAVIHQERIVIGKPDTQTPVFSDAMRLVVFQPDWVIPGSIKIKDLLPRLQEGDDDVLERHGMRISVNGRTVDPSKIKWDRVDIRTVPIVQDPGPSNPLGQLKFLFPNKHDVYMHDTPSKHLFNATERAFSHGCIRVRNPKRLAELVFGEDQNWSPDDIAQRLKPKATANNRVPLSRPIPVYNVYFTAIANPDGTVRLLDDVYGHDKRIIAALDGVPAAQIAQSDPARKQQRELKDIAGDPTDSVYSARALRRAASLSSGRSNLGGPVRSASAPASAPPSVSFFSGGSSGGSGGSFFSSRRTFDGQ